MKPILFLILVSLWYHIPLEAQGLEYTDRFWTDKSEATIYTLNAKRNLPTKFRLLELNFEDIEPFLAEIPLNFNAREQRTTRTLAIPLPDGSFMDFVIYSDPIMHPELARKYPEIKTFAGYGKDDPTYKLRMDLSPHGFNGQILSGEDAIYISPVAVGDHIHHMSYYQRYTSRDPEWKCLTEHKPSHIHDQNNMVEFSGDCGIRHEYRLALACAGEYAVAVGATTVAQTLAAMNTTMNRVNGIFERDCAVRMILIADNDDLISLDPATDPFANPNDADLTVDRNQVVIDSIIGNSNYDIGHIFTTGSGGFAPGNTCSGSKAKATTGQSDPTGDKFDVDYVAHEMGHQFNANHTQYNDCNRWGPTAVEPGSASTIMGYAGICSPNVQSDAVNGSSDDYFSTVSVVEIRTYVATGGGSGCDNEVTVANAAPTVSSPGDFIIPHSTPFVLTATASDPDGDVLTYCWEQVDNYVAPMQTMPPASGNTSGPVFRSLDPDLSPSRYFPKLADLVVNFDDDWEELPSVGRDMNFRVTVRDNFPSAGCAEEALSKVTTEATSGPFQVTSIGLQPNCLNADDMTTITWDVANSDLAPVNCANVDILLSTDGGFTYPIALASNVPNDGTHDVFIPETIITEEGRIQVRCADNIFFNINNENIRIDCRANWTINFDPVPDGVYQVRENIETSGTVTVAGTVRFYAGEEIKLNPGFHALPGSDFLARIQPCDPCGTPSLLADGTSSSNLPNGSVTLVDLQVEERDKQKVQSGTTGLKASVYPNPFTRDFTIALELKTTEKISIQIMDINGRLMHTVINDQQLVKGMHQFKLISANWYPGVYFCQIKSKSKTRQLQLVKVD